MKITYRDDWRVVVEIRPRYTHTPISALGFDGLDGQLAGDPFEITVAPQRLGDLGYISMSDSLISKDIDGDYRRRCEALLAEMLKRPHVRDGRVTCTETHVCSHCHCTWEVLDAEDAANDAAIYDEHSVEGEPVCCDKAIAEFRTERGIPQVHDGVVAYRNPDRPDSLVCREHGYGWAGLTPLKSEDLPDGGICTYGRPSDTECGRDVLIVAAGESL